MGRKLLSVELLTSYLLLLVCQISASDIQHRQNDDKGGYSNNSLNQSSSQLMPNLVLNKVLPSIRSNCSSDDCCPPWFYYNGSDCVCGRIPRKVISCDNTLKQSAVLDCYCVTFDKETNSTVAGACIYNCENVDKKKGINFDVVYHTLPSKLSDLNKFMCHHHWLNRTGPLCGQCVNESYPLAYSYNLSCVSCPDGHRNWWKFILAAFAQLTVFYFIVLFFKINATSSHLHGYVFFSQAISIPAFVRLILPALINTPKTLKAVKIIISFYGIWNLDFFRALLPHICLKTTILQTLALDYAIAVFPLLLMIVSYTLIELHDRNFKVVVYIWKPFRFVFTFFRRNWDSHTSVIDAYATFFLLSFQKVLSTCYDLLTPARLYRLNSSESNLVLYYDGSIKYFGTSHLPYAILAIVVFLLFIVLPMTVLFLYPFKFFQKFLGCFPTRWYNILHTFVESFLGCYKDGTEPGTRDYRWFAVLFLLWRLLGIQIYSMTLGSTFFPGAILLLLLLTMLLVTVQPFKPEVAHYTKFNITFVLLLAFFYASIMGMNISSIKGMRCSKAYAAFTSLFVIIPLVYISLLVIHWLFAQRKWGKNLILKFKAWRQGYDWMTFENEQDFEDSLPDRIANPDQYHEGNLSNFHTISTSQQELNANTY